MQRSGKIKVADLNNLLTCMLCKGYYIDATTIVECLHSFCRTCIVRYLKAEKNCPRCEVQVHKTKPLNYIRSDQTLQDIVYKLVPNLFKNEMKRRRDFYSQKNIAPRDIPSSSEKRGDVWGCDRLIFTPDDVISVSLEYYPLPEPLPLKLQTNSFPIEAHRRFFRCPGALKIYHLKKLLQAKHNMPPNSQIDILYMHDYLKNEYTLVDLAYIYAWKRSDPLRLFYKISQESERKCASEIQLPKLENNKEFILSSESNCAVACSSVTFKSSSSTLATTPSSRQFLRPPSPQMAEEPKEISLEKPNCAAMQSLPNVLIQSQPVSVVKLKSALKKAVNKSNSCPLVSPDPLSIDSLKRKSADSKMSSSLACNQTSGNNLIPVSNFPKKKKVTFSVDLVQDCYNKLPKYNNHSLLQLKSVNDSAIGSVIHMRNRVVSNKSS